MIEKYALLPMTNEDLEQVIELQSNAYYAVAPESKASFQNKLALSPETHWVIRHDSEIVAYLVALPIKYNNPPLLNQTDYPLTNNPDTIYIHDLSVAPEKRGMQLGSMLVEQVLKAAKAKKFMYVSLIAVQDSTDFWCKFGFNLCNALPQELASKVKSYGPDAHYMDINLTISGV